MQPWVCVVRKQTGQCLLLWVIYRNGCGLGVFSSSSFFHDLFHIPAVLISAGATG